jgi:hypothetical protein
MHQDFLCSSFFCCTSQFLPDEQSNSSTSPVGKCPPLRCGGRAGSHSVCGVGSGWGWDRNMPLHRNETAEEQLGTFWDLLFDVGVRPASPPAASSIVGSPSDGKGRNSWLARGEVSSSLR